jgi:hypothetical protein
MHLNNYHDYEQESSQGPVQPRIDQVHTKIDPNYAMQGKIFFLPAKAELPEGAVTRRGKGLVEDGVYNHPVVVVSHPYDDEDFVHFLLVSVHSRTGKHGTPLTLSRSPLSKTTDLMNYIPTRRRTPRIKIGGHGISQLRQHPTTRTPSRKRRRSNSRLLYLGEEQPFVTTLMLVFGAYIRSSIRCYKNTPIRWLPV